MRSSLSLVSHCRRPAAGSLGLREEGGRLHARDDDVLRSKGVPVGRFEHHFHSNLPVEEPPLHLPDTNPTRSASSAAFVASGKGGRAPWVGASPLPTAKGWVLLGHCGHFFGVLLWVLWGTVVRTLKSGPSARPSLSASCRYSPTAGIVAARTESDRNQFRVSTRLQRMWSRASAPCVRSKHKAPRNARRRQERGREYRSGSIGESERGRAV